MEIQKYIEKIHEDLKVIYDHTLNPVKFEELKELAHGERGKEIDEMLKEFREKQI